MTQTNSYISDAGTLKRIDYSLIKGGGKTFSQTADDDAAVITALTYYK
jgi:hypothetical protein